MKTVALLLAIALLQDPVPEQEPPPEQGGDAEAPEAPQPSPQAAEAWAAIVAATSLPGERATVTAFHLNVEVIARQGVQTNDLKDVSYRYLAPHYIRFGLGTNRETGRGPGAGQGSFWLRDGERVIKLAGRDYQQDRDLVRRMTTIAQNVIALSDPAKLTIRNLELRSQAPGFLPESLQWRGKRLDWIEYESPDFDLYRDAPPRTLPTVNPDGTIAGPPERVFRVLIGADRKTHRPELVVLREEGEPGTAIGEPLLFELKDHVEVNGFVLPHKIQVRGYEPGVRPSRFQEKPAQEIAILTANLAPELTPDDFLP